ncbi:MAG: hypothetical protein J3K34DRAFT_456471 [Monoraphidium minutum]|nr:MAG: hypothetical protein J3K34DRAFT_456471 [Monoraphidium minutum]
MSSEAEAEVVAESWEALETLADLKINDEAPQQGPEGSERGSAEASGTPPPVQQPEPTGEACDIALRQALSGESRSVVLQLEALVDKFVAESEEEALEFPPNGSNYQRMLMHKVAQHYKLQTYTTGAAVAGQGQVVAKRTKWTQAPQAKLSTLPYKPRPPSAGTPPPPPPAPAHGPKALMKRPGSGSSLGRFDGGGPGGGGAGGAAKSHQERVEDYNAARERLLGKGGEPSGRGGGGGGGPEQEAQQQQQQQQQQGGPPPHAPPRQPHANGNGHHAAPPHAQHAPAPHGGRGGRGGGGGQNGHNGGGGGGGKAVYRDRERELQDPDYRRGLDRFTPRFDPGHGGGGGGYGPDGGALYNVPTYGSEFPTLGGGGGGRYNGGGGWGGQPPPPPPGGRKGGGGGGGGYARMGPGAPVAAAAPHMAMGVAYPGPAAFYPQGMMGQPAFAPIAGYMAPPMAGGYPMAYAYPGHAAMAGMPYAAGPMAYGPPLAHMGPHPAVQQHGGGWGPPLHGARPPPPPPQHPQHGGGGGGGGGGQEKRNAQS